MWQTIGMLIKNNNAHGSALKYLGGSALAAQRYNTKTCFISLSYRLAFNGFSSYPHGYGLLNAIAGPITLGGNLAARLFDNVGNASGYLGGVGQISGAVATAATVSGEAVGIGVGAGNIAGMADVSWTPHGWPAQMIGVVRIGDPTAENIADELFDGQMVSPGVSLRQALAAMAARLLAAAPVGPVLVLPAPPAATSTVAWVRCYDRHGAPEPGVVIQIRMDRVAGTGGAYTSEIAEYVSDEDGLVTAEIQRGAGLKFSARRGSMGKWITFDGVDDETLSLPSLLGTP